MKRKPSKIHALIGIEKPKGLTSHDVINRVRRALGERRVGHAGTLDPSATGVLIVGIGQATRLLGHITLHDKTYRARICFGVETTTDDAEGDVSACTPLDQYPELLFRLTDRSYAKELLAEFCGTQMQLPPRYSAISVGGIRSYEAARSGRELDLAPRKIEVFSAELVAIEQTKLCIASKGQARSQLEVASHSQGQVEPEGTSHLPYPQRKAQYEQRTCVYWTVDFSVSKGCYIRALARDLGRRAQTYAHLADLSRESSGPVTRGDCLGLEELNLETLSAHYLDPIRCTGSVYYQLNVEEANKLSHGIPFVPRLCSENRSFEVGQLVSLVLDNKISGLWRFDGHMLRSVCTFSVPIEGVSSHHV